MDVQIFSFAIPAIIVAFAITNADAGLIGTVTLLTSALGDWFAGALSDRFGRVRTLQSPSSGSPSLRFCAVLRKVTRSFSSSAP
jgi:MFS family permease